PWDGEERACGAGRFHRHLLNKDCRGASVPVAESIETGRGTPPKDVDSAAPQKHRKRRSGSIRDAPTDRKKLLSTAGIEAARRTAGRARVRLSVMTLLLLVPVRCFFCLPLLPPCQHSMALRCGRRCAARQLRFFMRGPRSALDAQ
ncbi:surface protease GP63, partial [Trypanosoma cruzi]